MGITRDTWIWSDPPMYEIRSAFGGKRKRGVAKQLAAKFGVTERQIWTIKSGRQWRNVG